MFAGHETTAKAVSFPKSSNSRFTSPSPAVDSRSLGVGQEALCSRKTPSGSYGDIGTN